MKTVTSELARQLIDFAPTEATKAFGFEESQIQGTVAAYNMLARNNCAYLADEVGMGKTYVALGVMGLVRHIYPESRVMIIAPRENIQLKWIKELQNFARANWKQVDNRFKSIQGTPVREPLACHSLPELARAIQVNEERDLFLRMTSFSIHVKESKGRRRCRLGFLRQVPWVPRRYLSSKDPDEFVMRYGQAMNAVIPELDLLIVDEGHNLKHGVHASASIRNRMLAYVFGGVPGGEDSPEWYGPRVKRLLFLSATPFEFDYADIYRQLSVFGFGKQKVVDGQGDDRLAVDTLVDPDAPEERKRAIVRRFLIRRVSYLNIAGKKHTKNMYRREWRRGGYRVHDEPMHIEDPRQRLAVALVQKKVAEILGSEQFNNHFQIGMLSSFESFMQSLRRSRHLRSEVTDEDEQDRVFDGNQDSTDMERPGIDTEALGRIISSYHDQFGRPLPHPKLDATAQYLNSAFATGEKVLVFVRRVATTGELKAKLDFVFDSWIEGHMKSMLPALKDEINSIFDRYRQERGHEIEEHGGLDDRNESSRHSEGLLSLAGEDVGGTDTFFAWFFRGEGPQGILSGAAFQKNRLAALGSVYSTLFEDDHVSAVLERPERPLGAMAQILNMSQDALTQELRARAFGYFLKRTTRREGYPRIYAYEGYQVAALQLLMRAGSDLADRAETILRERYVKTQFPSNLAPEGFPGPQEMIGISSFFTELVKRPRLREALWPDEPSLSFREQFRKREQRRELLSAMARLGAAYIDLYLLAIRELGSFQLGKEAQIERPERRLARDYLDLLESQVSMPGFHAYYELASAAKAFETLVSVNFPEVPAADLSRLAEIYGRTLQRQQPVGQMEGGVNKRLVRQFRMPGFPLIMVSTDVLQEGEDLHTFCKRVIHYGISWTPSAMEQRTGRVDRIGSLFQRRYDGTASLPVDDEWIQVHYPYLRDTVEVLQVERVLDRLDRFMRLIHRTRPEAGRMDSRIRADLAMIEKSMCLGPVEGPLESAFPVDQSWLEGLVGADRAKPLALGDLTTHLDLLWRQLVSRLGIKEHRTGSGIRRAGTAFIKDGHFVSQPIDARPDSVRLQPFDLELRSQAAGSATLLRCTSPVGPLDLRDGVMLDSLYDLQWEVGQVKVCVWWDARRHTHEVTIRRDLLFDSKTTQYDELEFVVRRVVLAADRIEAELLEQDAEVDPWLEYRD